MIGIFAATGMELAGLRKRLRATERRLEGDCVVESATCANREVLLVQTGMGKARAQAAAAFVLQRYPLEAAISLGFSGALVPELRAGDIVLCTAVRHDGDEPVECDAGLISRAGALPRRPFNTVTGVAATCDEFVSNANSKRALASKTDAIATDMESYWIGKAAAGRGIPFLSLRAISDSLDARLPPIERLIDSDGKWRKQTAVMGCVRRPKTVVEFLSLARNARKAGNSLASYAFDLLAAIAGAEPVRQTAANITVAEESR